MILADATATEMTSLVQDTAIFLSIAVNIMLLYTVNKTAKREVTIMPPAVSKEEFTSLKDNFEWLKGENTKVWEKMERDRVESLERIGQVASKVASTKSTLDAVATQVGLLNMKMDNLISRKS